MISPKLLFLLLFPSHCTTIAINSSGNAGDLKCISFSSKKTKCITDQVEL